MTKSISSLKNRNEALSDIVEKYIKPIDNNRYAFEFSKKTYDFFSYRIPYDNGNSFGRNIIKKPNENLYDESDPNVAYEIRIAEISLKRKHDYLKEISSQKIKDMKVVIKLMNNIIDALNY